MTDIVTETDRDRLRTMCFEDRCSDAAMLINAACLSHALDAWDDELLDPLGLALTQLFFGELEGARFLTCTIEIGPTVLIEPSDCALMDGIPLVIVESGWPSRRCGWEDVADALDRLTTVLHPDEA